MKASGCHTSFLTMSERLSVVDVDFRDRVPELSGGVLTVFARTSEDVRVLQSNGAVVVPPGFVAVATCNKACQEKVLLLPAGTHQLSLPLERVEFGIRPDTVVARMILVPACIGIMHLTACERAA
jgi:hypothetical protein